jgi:hypothetical protein
MPSSDDRRQPPFFTLDKGCDFGNAIATRSPEGAHMRWYHYLALFLAGAFLVNSVPHFTNGISGRPFPSPFASPPGQGLSSPVVNVLWGSFNFIVGIVLCRAGRLDSKRLVPMATVAVGGILMAVTLANAFGQVFAGTR